MNYSAADVKRLREATAAGMLDCKKALDERGLFKRWRCPDVIRSPKWQNKNIYKRIQFLSVMKLLPIERRNFIKVGESGATLNQT